MSDRGKVRLSAEKLMLAMALDEALPGTLIAGGFVDTDGTVSVQLLERRMGGWVNRTTNEPTSTPAIAARFDDVVTVVLPPRPREVRP